MNPEFEDKIINEISVKLADLKPEIKSDSAFFARLRSELVGENKPVISPFHTMYRLPNILNVSRFYFGALTAVFAILVTVPLTYFVTKQNNPSGISFSTTPFSEVKNVSTPQPIKPQISDKGMNAFGKLDVITPDKTATLSAISADAGMIAYVYKGAEVKLTETQGAVYRRTSNATTSAEVYTADGEPYGFDTSMESSSYALETDFNNILKIATVSRVSINGKISTSTLETPRKIYMKQNDMFIPALLFPATYEKDVEGPKYIIVQLVKDFLSITSSNMAGVGSVVLGTSTEKTEN